MKFEIHIFEESRNLRPRQTMTVEATNWFSALHSALRSMHEPIAMQNVNFTVLDDGLSAEVEDPSSTRTFLVQAIQEQATSAQPPPAQQHTQPPPPQDTILDITPLVVDEQESAEEQRTAAYDPDEMAWALQRVKAMPPPQDAAKTVVSIEPFPAALAHTETKQLLPFKTWSPPETPDVSEAPDISKVTEVPDTSGQSLGENPPPRRKPLPSATEAVPLLRPKSFSVQGFYMPGSTGQFLTDAFMKLANLYEHFGDDRKAAIRYVLNMLDNSIKADGGGVMLTDINDPSGILWFEVASGDAEAELLNLRLPSSQGLAGACRQHSSGLNIPDLSTDDEFQDDFLHNLGQPVGPVIMAPIENDGTFLGIHLRYRRQGSRAFTPGELSIFAYMSQSLGEYLAIG